MELTGYSIQTYENLTFHRTVERSCLSIDNYKFGLNVNQKFCQKNMQFLNLYHGSLKNECCSFILAKRLKLLCKTRNSICPILCLQ